MNKFIIKFLSVTILFSFLSANTIFAENPLFLVFEEKKVLLEFDIYKTIKESLLENKYFIEESFALENFSLDVLVLCLYTLWLDP